MNWIALLSQVVLPLLAQAPAIIKAWESSATGGLDAVNKVVHNTGLVGVLADAGAALFPKLDATLHAAAAALVMVHPNNTSWLQSGLNVLLSAGYITLPAGAATPGVTGLQVDGIYGPKTRAVVEVFQGKIGSAVNGFVSDLDYSNIAALLAKL